MPVTACATLPPTDLRDVRGQLNSHSGGKVAPLTFVLTLISTKSICQVSIEHCLMGVAVAGVASGVEARVDAVHGHVQEEGLLALVSLFNQSSVQASEHASVTSWLLRPCLRVGRATPP